MPAAEPVTVNAVFGKNGKVGKTEDGAEVMIKLAEHGGKVPSHFAGQDKPN
jgi:hypothetical protein